MNKSFIDESRKKYHSGSDDPTIAQLGVGCLQRIATACEAMAKDHLRLVEERQWMEARADENYERWQKTELSLSATRGVVTKLKKQLAKENCDE